MSCRQSNSRYHLQILMQDTNCAAVRPVRPPKTTVVSLPKRRDSLSINYHSIFQLSCEIGLHILLCRTGQLLIHWFQHECWLHWYKIPPIDPYIEDRTLQGWLLLHLHFDQPLQVCIVMILEQSNFLHSSINVVVGWVLLRMCFHYSSTIKVRMPPMVRIVCTSMAIPVHHPWSRGRAWSILIEVQSLGLAAKDFQAKSREVRYQRLELLLLNLKFPLLTLLGWFVANPTKQNMRQIKKIAPGTIPSASGLYINADAFKS